MRWLVNLCLSHCGTVAVLTFLALALGAWTANRIPLDVFPEFIPPSVEIQTEAPGLSPLQVEQLVTKPLENAVNGAHGVVTMRSNSIPGLSVISITFADGTDLYNARQGISERLSEVGGELPAGVGPPKLSPLVSSTKDLLMIGLVSDKVDAFTLRDRADWLLKPLLLAVPGVANIVTYGGDVRQIQIQPDFQKLNAYGFSEADLAAAAGRAVTLGGLGFMDLSHQRLLLQAPTPTPDLERLRNSVVAVRSGMPVLLGQVAQVRVAPALKYGDATVMGKPAVVIWVSGQYGSNTLATTRAVEAALRTVIPRLAAEGIRVYPALQRPANFIERALGNLEQAVAVAGVLILAVLYLFLRDWRSSLITFLAIPLSLTAAIMVLDRWGYTLNTMTLGGFAVSLGVLVDDAIIGIENILRRLRQNGGERPRLTVILDAALEVRGPVIYATLVAVAVFLPELFASNVQGRFIGPLAVTFILAVMASLLVALTATPALCALLLTERDARPERAWLARLKAVQARVIGAMDRHFRIAAGAIALAFIASLATLPFLGGTLMPDFKEGHFVLYVSGSPGTSLNEILAVGKRIERDLVRLPYVATVEQQAGRAELSEDTYGTNASEMHVELKPNASIDQDEAEDQLRGILARYPGLQTEVVTFLGDRINDSITGETAEVAIKIFGNDLEALDKAGNDVARALSGTPGIVDLQFVQQSDAPEIRLALKPQAMTATGLKASDVLNTLAADYSGETVGQTYVGIRSIDVALLAPKPFRSRLENVGALMIRGPLGPVPLSQVAHVVPMDGRYSIRHDGGQRLVSVTFNVSGRSLQSVVAAAKARIAGSVALPRGVYLAFSGAAAAERQARTELLLYSAFALALIVLVLFVCFRWPAHAWLVLVNLPFSLIGGIVAIAVSGVGLSLGALVGLVTVFGVSARNAILLFAHYEQLVENEGAPWAMATVVRGAQERLIPILMTAAVTALGLLPLALKMSQPGQEIEGPMAVTILGGLAISTLLNLLLLPVFAKRFSRRAAAHITR